MSKSLGSIVSDFERIAIESTERQRQVDVLIAELKTAAEKLARAEAMLKMNPVSRVTVQASHIDRTHILRIVTEVSPEGFAMAQAHDPAEFTRELAQTLIQRNADQIIQALRDWKNP